MPSQTMISFDNRPQSKADREDRSDDDRRHDIRDKEDHNEPRMQRQEWRVIEDRNTSNKAKEGNADNPSVNNPPRHSPSNVRQRVGASYQLDNPEHSHRARCHKSTLFE